MVSLVARSGMWRQNPPPAISIPRLIASEFLESSGIGNVSFQKWGHLIVIYILVILPKIFVNNPFFFFLVKFLLREKQRRWMSECWRMEIGLYSEDFLGDWICLSLKYFLNGIVMIELANFREWSQHRNITSYLMRRRIICSVSRFGRSSNEEKNLSTVRSNERTRVPSS